LQRGRRVFRFQNICRQSNLIRFALDLVLVLVLGFENQNFSRMKDENDDEDDSGRTSTMTREGNIRTRHGTGYRV